MITSKHRIIIGIDPGTNTGIAIWDRDKKRFAAIHTVAIHRAMEMVRNLHKLHDDSLYVRFEDARKRKFFKGENMAAKQQGAGSIKRDCSIWEDMLTDWKIQFDCPTAGKTKTKVDAKLFRLRTGWIQVTSNHARDAAMLVYGF